MKRSNEQDAGRMLYYRARTLPCGKPDAFGVTDAGWVHFETFDATCPDGREATVWVQRTPAIFSRVTFGKTDISFGSGRECLLTAWRLARMAADGLAGDAS